MIQMNQILPEWDRCFITWVNKVSSGVLMPVSNREQVGLSEAGNKISVERGLLS